jgi:putative sterol carrier protein
VADAVDRVSRSARGVRLVSLRRIRTQSVDAMMRWMPQYFRPYEADGLAFTTQFDLTGDGGGRWAMRIANGRCEVRPGDADAPDLTIRMPALLFLALHRGEASPVWGLLTGRIRLGGRRRLFLMFPRFFPTEAPRSRPHRWLFRARRLRRARRRS